MAKTFAASLSSSFVKKRGAGSFCSTHHHFTTSARRPNSSTLNERRMQTTLRSECPSRKSPRAAEPNKMTHSRFAPANSFSLLTSSVSFVSVESISNPFLSSLVTSFLKRLRLRCCRRQIPQIRRHRRLRRSLPRPNLPSRLPNASPRCPRAFPAETRASRFRPIRLRADHRREKAGYRSPERARSNRVRTRVPDSRRDPRCLESVPREADRLALLPNRQQCTWPTARRRPRLLCRSRSDARWAPSRGPHLRLAHH